MGARESEERSGGERNKSHARLRGMGRTSRAETGRGGSTQYRREGGGQQEKGGEGGGGGRRVAPGGREGGIIDDGAGAANNGGRSRLDCVCCRPATPGNRKRGATSYTHTHTNKLTHAHTGTGTHIRTRINRKMRSGSWSTTSSDTGPYTQWRRKKNGIRQPFEPGIPRVGGATRNQAAIYPTVASFSLALFSLFFFGEQNPHSYAGSCTHIARLRGDTVRAPEGGKL